MKIVRENITNFERPESEENFRNDLFPKPLKIKHGIPDYFTIEIRVGGKLNPSDTIEHNFRYDPTKKTFRTYSDLELVFHNLNIPYEIIKYEDKYTYHIEIDQKYVDWGKFEGYYENS